MNNIVKMQQVHGNNVVVVSKSDSGKIIPNCDGLITNDPNVTLCVRVADCLPISIIDKKGRGIGLVHAGWRGLEKEIIKKGIEKMIREYGIVINDIRIKIGPHICSKHYEVKEDVADKFKKYPSAMIKRDTKIFLDLSKVAKLQLESLGVKNKNVESDNKCTYEDADLPSFRQNKTNNRLSIYASLT